VIGKELSMISQLMVVTYSSVSGSANGTPIPFESCFDTIVVDPLTCDNGSVSPSISKYSHQITFNSQAVGASPTPVSLTYALSPTTKYFAYIFQGYNVWDELEIKFKLLLAPQNLLLQIGWDILIPQEVIFQILLHLLSQI
jgi:hypothetical protein